jgi:hypothetical protein
MNRILTKLTGPKNSANVLAILMIAVIAGLACSGMKRPWRDYSQKPFTSAEWLAGDKIERGRMIGDFKTLRSALAGLTPETVTSTLGPPDLKKTIEKREVWFYRVDIGIMGGMDLLPVSFDEKGKSMFGMVTGSTFSAMAKEEDLK